MLDFIWHLRGSVSLEGAVSNDAALDRIERLLDKQRKRETERGQNSLYFEDPLWSDPFGPNWLAMVIYDRGRFWIEEGLGGRRLRYDLRSLHGMIFCLFGALMFFFFGLAAGGVPGGLKFAGGVFAWLYGMNVLLALARVPRAIRKAVYDD
jgi:hypothetical protein